MEIISKIYSVKYGRHFYTGITEQGNLVNFPGGDDVAVGTKVQMTARVRKHVESNTTMLHYVKFKVDNPA